VIACLRSLGIPTLLLKGVALSLQYYRDPGVRSMEDADILVPPQDADRTILALEALGFQFRPIRPFSYLRNFTHAAEFYSQQLGKVDLHWHPIHEIRWHQSEAAFWQTSEALVIGDEESRVLHPTYQLFHLCCHAIRYMPWRDTRWILDTVTLIRCDGHRIDWDFLIREAQRFRRVLAIRDTLGYLSEKVERLVPPGILASLKKIPVSRNDQKNYEWQILPYGIRGRSPVFGNISWLWNYCMMESLYETPDGQMSLWKKGSQFEKFLRLRYGLTGRRQLAGMILKKAARRPWLLVR